MRHLIAQRFFDSDQKEECLYERCLLPVKDVSHPAPRSHGLPDTLELPLAQEPFGHGEEFVFFTRDVARMTNDEFVHRGSVERARIAPRHALQLRAQHLPNGVEFTMVVGQCHGDVAQAHGV